SPAAKAGRAARPSGPAEPSSSRNDGLPPVIPSTGPTVVPRYARSHRWQRSCPAATPASSATAGIGVRSRTSTLTRAQFWYSAEFSAEVRYATFDLRVSWNCIHVGTTGERVRNSSQAPSLIETGTL